MDNNDRPLSRAEAVEYLFIKHGIRRTIGTLAKYAVIGGGPRFRHAGSTPIYPPAELDAYAASILSPLKSSTSDHGEPHAA